MTKEDIIITEGPVVPVGVTDADENTPTKKMAKTLYANFINQETDTMHSFLKNNGVVIIGNTILEQDKIINGNNVKEGSWVATCRVTNPELIKNIKNGILTGYSLSTLPDFAKSLDYWINREKDEGNRKTYDDIEDFKEAEPKWISFVDKPNHGLGFDYWSREDFINKSKYFKDEDIMTNENKTENESVWANITGKLLDHVLVNKAETPAEPPAKEEDNKEFVTKAELKDELSTFKTEMLDEIKNIVKDEKGKEKPPEEETKPDDTLVNKEKPDEKEEKPPKEEEEEKKKAEDKTQKPKSEKPENTKTPNPMVNKSFREYRREQGKIIY